MWEISPARVKVFRAGTPETGLHSVVLAAATTVLSRYASRIARWTGRVSCAFCARLQVQGNDSGAAWSKWLTSLMLPTGTTAKAPDNRDEANRTHVQPHQTLGAPTPKVPAAKSTTEQRIYRYKHWDRMHGPVQGQDVLKTAPSSCGRTYVRPSQLQAVPEQRHPRRHLTTMHCPDCFCTFKFANWVFHGSSHINDKSW